MSSIFERVAKVMADVKEVPKGGYNSFSNYHYASDADITGAVRGPMAKHGVTMHLAEVAVLFDDIISGANKPQHYFRALFRFRFACGAEANEFFDTWVPGEAMDGGDKAFYQAITGAKKYALLTTFVLETDEDAEKKSPEVAPPKPATAQRSSAPPTAPAVPAAPPAPAAPKVPFVIKVNEAQAEILRDLLVGAEMDEARFCELSQIAELEELAAARFKGACEHLKSVAADIAGQAELDEAF